MRRPDSRGEERLDPTFRPLAEDFLKESDQLRREIVAQDLRIRQVQLRQIEARFGQDQHWHLLNFMLQARLNLDQLTKASAEHNLTPTLLSGLIENVKAAHAAGTSYMQAHPATSSDKSVQGIWEHLHTPATDYFKALDSLRDDWTAQRDSLYLDDDLEKSRPPTMPCSFATIRRSVAATDAHASTPVRPPQTSSPVTYSQMTGHDDRSLPPDKGEPS